MFNLLRFCLMLALFVAATFIVAVGPASAMSPQQTKFKSCAAAWTGYKTTNAVSGRKAYDTYMARCLKKPT